MQQESIAADGEQPQEPDWELASYGQRMGAWALDSVGFTLPFILLIIGLVVLVLGLIFSSESVTESITITSDSMTIEESIEESVLSGANWLVAIMGTVGVVLVIRSGARYFGHNPSGLHCLVADCAG